MLASLRWAWACLRCGPWAGCGSPSAAGPSQGSPSRTCRTQPKQWATFQKICPVNAEQWNTCRKQSEQCFNVSEKICTVKHLLYGTQPEQCVNDSENIYSETLVVHSLNNVSTYRKICAVITEQWNICRPQPEQWATFQKICTVNTEQWNICRTQPEQWQPFRKYVP